MVPHPTLGGQWTCSLDPVGHAWRTRGPGDFTSEHDTGTETAFEHPVCTTPHCDECHGGFLRRLEERQTGQSLGSSSRSDGSPEGFPRSRGQPKSDVSTVRPIVEMTALVRHSHDSRTLWSTDSRLTRSKNIVCDEGDAAFRGDGLRVQGSVHLRRGNSPVGGFRLWNASVGNDVEFRDVKYIRGIVRLNGSSIGRDLIWLDSASFEGTELHLQGASCRQLWGRREELAQCA